MAKDLEQFGISDRVTRSFSSGENPSLVNYLDLIRDSDRSPDGAVEHENRPILYFVNDSRLSADRETRAVQFAKLTQSIACRGDRCFLAVIKPGKLEITPVRLGRPPENWRVFSAEDSNSINFYTNLVHGKLDDHEADEPDLVFREMYNLLRTGADQIAHKIGRENVLSLVGRALFFRFLCDRGIVTENDAAKICPQASELRGCFDDSEKAYQTSKWLDQTFNGNFLPLKSRGTRQFFEDLNRSAIVFKNLSAIVRGLEPTGENQFQKKFDWAVFDFAHVPVGLLSQVYEAFSWQWDYDNAEETSVHYTPRNIALTVVDEAFDGLANPTEARVLDPACGAGVFLVLAFRRLYMEHWRAAGKRPSTAVIRQILERQLCGFDISESALRLSALSLYLTAIELDPDPIPPEKLRFNDLDGLVLFNHRKDDDSPTGPVVGSLREDVGAIFHSSFDLVISNPPWSAIDSESVVAEIDALSKQVVSRRDAALGSCYENPRGEPDLPFLWQATEWCRRGGQIAMVLPARILFRQGDNATHARNALFQTLRFTGIVNCSNIRKTNVWPGMDYPFILVFARNDIPPEDSSFWFISPQADYTLNQKGETKIDSESAILLEAREVVENPWVLKTLAIGTTLDVQVIRKLAHSSDNQIGRYWTDTLKLSSVKGYSVEGPGNKDASLMQGLPDAGIANQRPIRFTIDHAKSAKFNHQILHRSVLEYKDEDPLIHYRGPLFLLRQTLPRDRRTGISLTSYADTTFNQSFYGYSSHGHPQAELLVKYLHIIAHSPFWSYYVLCTSAKLGVERPVFLKEDFEAFPIISIDALKLQEKEEIIRLAERLDNGDTTVFAEIDVFLARLYGLTKNDLQVIEDTLTVRNPHDELGRRGSTAPTSAEVERFANSVRSAINPFARKIGKQTYVHLVPMQSDDTFRFLTISASKENSVVREDLKRLVLKLADKTGTTMIVQIVGKEIQLGILNQFRYWTRSRARLLASMVIRDYFEVFEEQHANIYDPTQ